MRNETVTVEAADIRVGDIVRIGAGVAGRVDKIISTTPKTITYQFTYTQCDLFPVSVGKSRSTSRRLGTAIQVERVKR